MATLSIDTEHERLAREAYLQLAAAADRFERYENPHAVRIAVLADRLAESFHLAAQDRSLTEEERLDLTRHPVIGEQEAARASADRAVQLLVRWHHEWWNGCGYPDALRQNEIPLAARILRLADSYAALTDWRPYRPALSESEARQRIIERAAIEFDPSVVSVFIALPDMEELHSFARPVGTTATIDESPAMFSSFT